MHGFAGWTEGLRFAGEFFPGWSVLAAAGWISESWDLPFPQGMESLAVPPTGIRYQQHPGCWRFPTQLEFGRVELPSQSSRKARDVLGEEMDK